MLAFLIELQEKNVTLQQNLSLQKTLTKNVQLFQINSQLESKKTEIMHAICIID